MSRVDMLHPQDPELEPFLYASVGRDISGNTVTVLSALARLNLDPWKEAVDLGLLSRKAARARLETLLSKFRDVPSLEQDHGSVAKELTLLLPERPASRDRTQAGSPAIERQDLSRWSIFAILMILLLMAQILLGGAPWSGD